MNGLCRICLRTEESDKMLRIFESDCNIALNIFLCTQIKTIESKHLIALICEFCLKELSIAINFRKNARNSFLFFKNQLRDVCEDPNNIIKIEEESNEQVKDEPIDNYGLIQNREMISVDNLTEFENVNVNSYDEHSSRKKKRSKKTVIDKLNNFKCKYCEKTYSSKAFLNRHLSRAHSDCLDKSFTKNEAQSKSIEKELFCEICRNKFTTCGSLRKHIKAKHEYVDNKDKYSCDHCGQHFVLKYFLERHIKIRHVKNHVEKKLNNFMSAIPCDVCGKILKNRGLLKPHMRTHQIMKPDDYWYCDLCPRKFKTRGGCTWHIQQRHVLKATFVCPYDNCNVVYKGKWELKCHIKSRHTNIRDHRCEICGKGFIDRQKLQIHTRVHTGERPHACHFCSATFIHQTDLRRHIWGHTGLRPYKCEVPNCGKGFMKRSELLNHTNRCHTTSSVLSTQ